jgi:hypothetical protein
MGLTSAKKVTSGYFRNHSYVLLGLSVLIALAAWASRGQLPLWPPLLAAGCSYAAAAVWLYEKRLPGILLLWCVAACSVAGTWASQAIPADRSASLESQSQIGSTGEVVQMSRNSQEILWRLDPPTAGLLLGTTIAAMFLGHWYLNSPTMEIAPLRRLILLLSAAIALRALVCGCGLFMQWQTVGLSTTEWLLVGLHWIAGIVATGVLAAMAWQTLKIPNTQSATGILYVAVITTFLGELTSLLLSGSTAFPL